MAWTILPTGEAKLNVRSFIHEMAFTLRRGANPMRRAQILAGTHPLCFAVQGLMIPSLSKMRAYCSHHPCACPVYRRFRTFRERVPRETAVALSDAGVRPRTPPLR